MTKTKWIIFLFLSLILISLFAFLLLLLFCCSSVKCTFKGLCKLCSLILALFAPPHPSLAHLPLQPCAHHFWFALGALPWCCCRCCCWCSNFANGCQPRQGKARRGRPEQPQPPHGALDCCKGLLCSALLCAQEVITQRYCNDELHWLLSLLSCLYCCLLLLSLLRCCCWASCQEIELFEILQFFTASQFIRVLLR